MTLTKRGFTLLEMLVVISMIAIILASFVTSISGAQQRARIQKATTEVKAISQAILGYENFLGPNETLPARNNTPIDKSSVGFLFGKSRAGVKLPILLQVAMSSGGKVLDPWGQPYRLTIKAGSTTIKFGAAEDGSLWTGCTIPNANCLQKGDLQ